MLPWIDSVRHGLSGFLWACLGFTLLELFFGKPDTKRKYFGFLLFSFCFTLALALVWEMVEYLGTATMHVDMQEDQLVQAFDSYYLTGTHNQAYPVRGVLRTILQLQGGGELIIEGGYLDIGLYDTLDDMLICFVWAVLFVVVFTLDYFFFRRTIEKLTVPTVLSYAPKGAREPAPLPGAGTAEGAQVAAAEEEAKAAPLAEALCGDETLPIGDETEPGEE